MSDQATATVQSLLLESDPFDAAAVTRLRQALAQGPGGYRELREPIRQLEARLKTAEAADAQRLRLKLGVAEYLRGHLAAAAAHLGDVANDKTGLAAFTLGRVQMGQGEFAAAADSFARAAQEGYDRTEANLARVGALRAAGRVDEAIKLLHELKATSASSAEYHYQLGMCTIAQADPLRALKEFEKALSLQPHHPGALFQIAYVNDLYGNDEEAIRRYEHCLRRPPVTVGTLINLGILYEDNGQYEKASRCYRRVLHMVPSHPRASLFARDVRSSRNMYYDEDAERRYDRFSQLLEIPVTDFELSVRSRNCLKKMNIRTLGDLTRTTEAQLLSSKNFGETSLQEIKEMMASKGLRLGMALESSERNDYVAEPEEVLSPEEQAILARPISELNLSVRARKCMTKLGISTIGDLLQRNGDDLLECKNFGVTSLNEVRAKLSELGLALKGE